MDHLIENKIEDHDLAKSTLKLKSTEIYIPWTAFLKILLINVFNYSPLFYQDKHNVMGTKFLKNFISKFYFM